jgi:hypothetical protein
MAVTRNQDRNNAPAARTEREPSQAKKTLGFFNINIPTVGGTPIRVDAVRLMEGTKVHEQLAAYLGCTRPGDEKLQGEELVAEKAKRLAEVVSKLEFSFNPTRTEEESLLALGV